MFDVVDLLNSTHVLDQSVNDSGSAIMIKLLQPTAVPETMHVLVCPVVNQSLAGCCANLLCKEPLVISQIQEPAGLAWALGAQGAKKQSPQPWAGVWGTAKATFSKPSPICKV